MNCAVRSISKVELPESFFPARAMRVHTYLGWSRGTFCHDALIHVQEHIGNKQGTKLTHGNPHTAANARGTSFGRRPINQFQFESSEYHSGHLKLPRVPIHLTVQKKYYFDVDRFFSPLFVSSLFSSAIHNGIRATVRCRISSASTLLNRKLNSPSVPDIIVPEFSIPLLVQIADLLTGHPLRTNAEFGGSL